MTLTIEQKDFFEENGYLPYKRVLSGEELKALRQRCEDIAEERMSHVAPRYIFFEEAVQNGDNTTGPRIDKIRKIAYLSYHDDLFQAVAKKAEIVDAIEEFLGPNIKIYTDQLFVKPRFKGTITDWHQDSVAWPMFAPQNHVSCWIALDDATVENGCMTVIPGSHKLGSIAREYRDRFVAMPELADPVPVELKAGHCMFHHGLTFHRTSANTTPNHRRAFAVHYISAETMYMGIIDEVQRLNVEGVRGNRSAPFMLIRGQEFPGRV